MARRPRRIAEAHSSAAYGGAAHLGLRLGRPVGVTPNGMLVFQPVGMELRITIEYPALGHTSLQSVPVRVGIYRYQGLGCWYQTATVYEPSELHRLTRVDEPPNRDLEPSLGVTPPPMLAIKGMGP